MRKKSKNQSGGKKPAPAVVLRSEDVAAKPAPVIGRPSTFSEEKALRMCELVAQGYSLRKAVEIDPTLPPHSTFLLWCHENPALANQYARARASAMHALAEDIMQISDATDPANVNVARLQVETRKWLMSKLAPNVFGDRVTLAGDANAPLVIGWAGDDDAPPVIDVTPDAV